MITSLALVTLLLRAVGTGLILIVAADDRIDLPDAPERNGRGWAFAAKRPTTLQSAARPVPYLRILASYASYATPIAHRRLRHQSRGPIRRFWTALAVKKAMAEASPAISHMHKAICTRELAGRAYFHSTFITS